MNTSPALLVCATPPAADPVVVLAHGSYESGDERVFWRETPGTPVLRLPLHAPVSVRPVRPRTGDHDATSGERRLVAAITPHRVPAQRRPEPSHPDLTPRLTTILRDGGAADARTAAALVSHLLRGAEPDATRALSRALDGEPNPLSQRECSVLHSVADGHTNVEIATVLGMAPATVKTHLDHIYAKTGTVHRAAAVARALRQGWIS